MAVRKNENKAESSCIIKCNPQRMLTSGYTKTKIMPENYSKIILITGMTGKSIQEVTNELLSYAIKNAKIKSEDGFISLPNFDNGEEKE